MRLGRITSVVATVLLTSLSGYSADGLKVPSKQEYEQIPVYSEALTSEPISRSNRDTVTTQTDSNVLPDQSIFQPHSDDIVQQMPYSDLIVSSAPRPFESPRPYIPETAKTLFEYLPPVGNQTRSDCVAWAFGYASITCQIAQERRRRPSAAFDMFSPDFIFNGIEQKYDGTIDIGDTLHFLTEYGCASTASSPIGCEACSEQARREAGLYKAWMYNRAENLDQIRSSISNGYPVVITVRQSNFGSNSKPQDFDPSSFIYGINPAKKYNGKANHALTVVGYDDDRRALLIMNSYGDGWYDKGFCWVSYNLFTWDDGVFQGDAIGESYWCKMAFIVRVKRKNNSSVTYEVNGYPGSSRSNNAFEFRNSRVHNNQKAISLKGWKVSEVATNKKSLFAFVDSINDSSKYSGRTNEVIELQRGGQSQYSWSLLSNSWKDPALQSRPSNRPKFSMMATTPSTNVHVLTESGKIFEFDETKRWLQEVQLPMAADESAVDLRKVSVPDSRDGQLHVTSSSGSVYALRGDQWTIK